ncbi:MAG: GntR family transcriptional regulator [Firmicutes bacterium]|nr:GntR family transcriptional regulator [Bacillota bacterium]
MEIIIRNSSEQPIYMQICEQVKSQIISGALAAGTMLPSIRSLARDLRISVITTKRAYDELEAEGFICTVPGKGCFVAEQDLKLAQEANLRRMEEHLQQAAALAKGCGVGKEELLAMFGLLLEEE